MLLAGLKHMQNPLLVHLAYMLILPGFSLQRLDIATSDLWFMLQKLKVYHQNRMIMMHSFYQKISHGNDLLMIYLCNKLFSLSLMFLQPSECIAAHQEIIGETHLNIWDSLTFGCLKRSFLEGFYTPKAWGRLKRRKLYVIPSLS